MPNQVDRVSITLAKHLCSGDGVSINLTELSRVLGKHRVTVRKRVNKLLEMGVINPPVCPFPAVFKHFSLLIVTFADLPHDEHIVKRIKDDGHVFALSKLRERGYNSLLLQFHKSVVDYQLWRERLAEKIGRFRSESIYVPNQLMFKYNPSAVVSYLEEDAREGKLRVNGWVMDKLSFEIVKLLTQGKCIRINENTLSRKLKVHRHTISRKVKILIKEGIISNPVCRLGKFFSMSNIILIPELVEVNRLSSDLVKQIKRDPHISVAYRISEGRYNVLLLETFRSIEEHLNWMEENYRERYPGIFGYSRVFYIPTKNIVFMDQQKVVMHAIDEMLEEMKT